MSKRNGFDREDKRNRANLNQAYQKYIEDLSAVEHKVSHKRLKARALCTHTKEPLQPALEPKRNGDKVTWVCKFCGEEMSLKKLSDQELNETVQKINQICDMIKIMNTGSKSDRELIEKVIADVQLKVNAYLIPAYRAALQTSAKRHLRNNRGNRRRGGMEWGSGSY